MSDHMGSVPASSLEALAEFLPATESPEFCAGAITAPPTQNGVRQMPHANYTPITSRFHQAAYENGWVLSDFNWMEWATSSEALGLQGSNEAIDHASASQLMKLLTVCVRSERFSEGALLQAFESGLMLAIIRRAVVLASH